MVKHRILTCYDDINNKGWTMIYTFLHIVYQCVKKMLTFKNRTQLML